MAETRIYSKDGSEAIARCDGPTWTGACPKAEAGAPVLCAGRLIATAGPEGVLGLVLLIDPDTTTCPLSALGPFFLKTEGGRDRQNRNILRKEPL